MLVLFRRFCSSVCISFCLLFFFFFKQKTAYEMRISDWSSDVCSSDLYVAQAKPAAEAVDGFGQVEAGALELTDGVVDANVPARYVYGTVEAPLAQVQNWVGGTENANATLDEIGRAHV